jgi:hypothetical protein
MEYAISSFVITGEIMNHAQLCKSVSNWDLI